VPKPSHLPFALLPPACPYLSRRRAARQPEKVGIMSTFVCRHGTIGPPLTVVLSLPNFAKMLDMCWMTARSVVTRRSAPGRPLLRGEPGRLGDLYGSHAAPCARPAASPRGCEDQAVGLRAVSVRAFPFLP
jgi:hypothetical protein